MYIEFGVGEWLEKKVLLYALTHQVRHYTVYSAGLSRYLFVCCRYPFIVVLGSSLLWLVARGMIGLGF